MRKIMIDIYDEKIVRVAIIKGTKIKFLEPQVVSEYSVKKLIAKTKETNG